MKNNINLWAFMAIALSVVSSPAQADAAEVFPKASDLVTKENYNKVFAALAKMQRRDSSVDFKSAKKLGYTTAGAEEFKKFEGKTWKDLEDARFKKSNSAENKALALLVSST